MAITCIHIRGDAYILGIVSSFRKSTSEETNRRMTLEKNQFVIYKTLISSPCIDLWIWEVADQ